MVHSWGGCPTWQLSKYFLGLTPRFDVGPRHFDLSLHVGAGSGGGGGGAAGVDDAEGQVPCRGSPAVGVKWVRGTKGAGPGTKGAEYVEYVEYTISPGSLPVYVRGCVQERWNSSTRWAWFKKLISSACLHVPRALMGACRIVRAGDPTQSTWRPPVGCQTAVLCCS